MIEQENVIAVVCAMYKALSAEDKKYILGYMAGRMNEVADRDEQVADAAPKNRLRSRPSGDEAINLISNV